MWVNNGLSYVSNSNYSAMDIELYQYFNKKEIDILVKTGEIEIININNQKIYHCL